MLLCFFIAYKIGFWTPSVSCDEYYEYYPELADFLNRSQFSELDEFSKDLYVDYVVSKRGTSFGFYRIPGSGTHILETAAQACAATVEPLKAPAKDCLQISVEYPSYLILMGI